MAISLQDVVNQDTLTLSEKILHQVLLLSSTILGASGKIFHFSFINYFCHVNTLKGGSNLVLSNALCQFGRDLEKRTYWQ